VSNELEALYKELATAQQTVEQLRTKLAFKGLPPFCEEDFKSDDFTKFYTGLPNLIMA